MNRFSGHFLLLSLLGGCAATTATAPQGALQSDAAPSANATPVIRQPMADETRPAQMSQPLTAAEMPSDRVVARVNGKPISMAELQKPLIEGYGLKVLLFEVQLHLARQEAEKKNIQVTPADVDAEMDRTFQTGFKDADKKDYPALLDQLLARNGVSRGEFDMVIETNAILRKIAEPQLKDRITEENVKEAFNAVYGQTVIIRHIQCANPQEALAVQRRIAAGEKFEEVARVMSQNPRTAPLGGELPPISRQSTIWPDGLGKIPDGFREWAFTAKEGEISDPVQGDNAYHILKLDRKIEPKVVKFDDVKVRLRAELYEKLVDQGINALRGQLAGMARSAMVIEDPVLRRQFEAKLAEQQKAAKDVRQDILDRAAAATTQPKATTAPAGTAPTVTPPGDTAPKAPQPPPAGERPPATPSAPGAADLNK